MTFALLIAPAPIAVLTERLSSLGLAEVAWVRIPRPTTKFLCIWNRINVHAR